MSTWEFEGSTVQGPMRKVYTQDLIETVEQQRAWGHQLAPLLKAAMTDCTA